MQRRATRAVAVSFTASSTNSHLYDPNPNAQPWNDGMAWSDEDILDLRASLASGDSIVGVAKYLQRTESDVREKLKDLRLGRL